MSPRIFTGSEADGWNEKWSVVNRGWGPMMRTAVKGVVFERYELTPWSWGRGVTTPFLPYSNTFQGRS